MAEKARLAPETHRLLTQDLDEYRGVLVSLEQTGGEAAPVSWELVGAGRRLADQLGVKLTGVLAGFQVRGLATEALEYGCDQVVLYDQPVLEQYRTIPYTTALVNAVQELKPEIVLLGATSLGRDLAGAAATELATGLTADCTELGVDSEKRLLLATRPTFGGKQMATIVCEKYRPQMATVRPRVMETPVRQPGRGGEILERTLDLQEQDVTTKVLELIREVGEAVFLDRAEIIVAGGRGLGNKENFALVEELAGVLGGVVGASRAAVEAGWISSAHQVGQTGTTVRPKIYLAIGISGAIQHLVGMQNSDIIVAINSDPDASIFQIATYGIVGDLFEVVPALTEEFRRRLAGKTGQGIGEKAGGRETAGVGGALGLGKNN